MNVLKQRMTVKVYSIQNGDVGSVLKDQRNTRETEEVSKDTGQSNPFLGCKKTFQSVFQSQREDQNMGENENLPN